MAIATSYTWKTNSWTSNDNAWASGAWRTYSAKAVNLGKISPSQEIIFETLTIQNIVRTLNVTTPRRILTVSPFPGNPNK